MYNKILILILSFFVLFNELIAQDTQSDFDIKPNGEFEVFTSDIEGFKLSFTSNLYPLEVGKKIVFGLKGTSLSNEKQFKPHIIFLNIFNSGKNPKDSRLVFSKMELEDKYVIDFTFWKTGKYNFEVEIQNEDSLDVNEIYRFAFTQVVNGIDAGDDAQSHHNFMGMGSVMLIVMGALMLALMVLIGMNSASHR